MVKRLISVQPNHQVQCVYVQGPALPLVPLVASPPPTLTFAALRGCNTQQCGQRGELIDVIRFMFRSKPKACCFRPTFKFQAR